MSGNQSLADAAETATMDCWLLVEAFGEMCVFGFASWHPSTGGLSYVLSTRIIELAPDESRARTISGRVYSLGRRITEWDLDEEGSAALQLLTYDSQSGYQGDRVADVEWVTSQKMARHLGIPAPPRGDPEATDEYCGRHRNTYLALLSTRKSP